VKATYARGVAAAVSVCLLLGLLSGCGSTSSQQAVSSAAPPTGSYVGPAISGHVLAGTRAVIGASVQLYASGSAGNGMGATALGSSATTDSAGAFTIASGYACPTSDPPVYLVARGGKPGSSASSNAAITFVGVRSACSTAAGPAAVNEVTTVAAAYALSQFVGTGASIGATSSNATGLRNAFATAGALADPSTGASPGAGFATNGSSPASVINTVANVLDACAIQSTPTVCTSLFATSTNGATAPDNTLDAALALVRAPAANVGAVYALSTSSAMFAPALGSAPTDFTLAIDYTGGGMNQPSGLGIDGSGNIWVASYGNAASLFSPLGKPAFANGIAGLGLSASYGLAVDANGNAWIPNEPSPGATGNTVSVLNSSGQSIAGPTGFSSGGLNYPVAVAIDPDGSAWVADYGNSHLTHLSSSGQALSGTAGYASTQLAFPVALAVEASHNVWVANQSNGTLTRVSADGSQFLAVGCCNAPSNLAIDGSGNVWVTNFYGDSVSEVSPTGSMLSAGYTGGGLNHPQTIAVDGSGNLWVSNYRGNSITELAGASATAPPGTPLSPAAGLGAHAAMVLSYAIAIDASGNVWVTNFGSNTLTEFVGLAAPVRTPLIGPPVLP
jgi:NHL repeat